MNRRMQNSQEWSLILMTAFSILMPVIGDSQLYQPHEVEVDYNSHLPVQPELVRIFHHCHKRSGTFDLCIKSAFNELRVYFGTGKCPLSKIFFDFFLIYSYWMICDFRCLLGIYLTRFL